MPRYFIEVAYTGTRYSGFQMQLNANTIQCEVTRALKIFFNKEYALNVSSRTDAGVHAVQNFFHFDSDNIIDASVTYNLNALLPYDIAVKNIFETKSTAHCRFDAIARTYNYHITRFKNPFYFERAFYYPFAVDEDLLNGMAEMITNLNDFTSFSKKKTNVKSFNCRIEYSRWVFEQDRWWYEIKGNRFLRGMVKGLVATMLKLAKNKKGSDDLIEIFEKKDCLQADFSVSSHGLYLTAVDFKNDIFPEPEE